MELQLTARRRVGRESSGLSGLTCSTFQTPNADAHS